MWTPEIVPEMRDITDELQDEEGPRQEDERGQEDALLQLQVLQAHMVPVVGEV